MSCPFRLPFGPLARTLALDWLIAGTMARPAERRQVLSPQIVLIARIAIFPAPASWARRTDMVNRESGTGTFEGASAILISRKLLGHQSVFTNQ
jgi:hypothetical protein